MLSANRQFIGILGASDPTYLILAACFSVSAGRSFVTDMVPNNYRAPSLLVLGDFSWLEKMKLKPTREVVKVKELKDDGNVCLKSFIGIQSFYPLA